MENEGRRKAPFFFAAALLCAVAAAHP